MGIAAFLYGAISYTIFLASFVYAIGFVGNGFVPKSIDTPPAGAMPEAFLIDLLLLGLFALRSNTAPWRGRGSRSAGPELYPSRSSAAPTC